MTAAPEPLMTTEEFEELARVAGRVSEGVRLEYIEGKLGAKAVPDGDHVCVLTWLMRVLFGLRPDLWMCQEQGLKIDSYRTGRARPDATITQSGGFAGQPEWADPGSALMVVEVTSHDQDTDRRDRQEKPRAYARTGIPIYLLIDREKGRVVVRSNPVDGEYERILIQPFGTEVGIPEPVGITLDTEPLKAWVS
ncbi:Uma2 family endonuclease [Nocardia rhizosphaerae]|uniref:Uma2 family endonuclease n=1 Tax=Nocardia rhizosphaerae TaxID=1691571 RepID=A0ABV8L1C5_9NOCA